MGTGDRSHRAPHPPREHSPWAESPRGGLLIASCRSGSSLASEVAARFSDRLPETRSGNEEPLHLPEVDFRFSNSETCVRLDRDVSGRDVFLFQALFDPGCGQGVDHNYMAFLIAARTFREWGANHVTAVLPYLAYTRQDKPTRFTREPTTARLLADLSREAGIDRLITWEPHIGQIRGFYGYMPVHILESLPLFADEFRRFKGREEVIVVAPDTGASKLVTHFGRLLGLNVAIASKHRPRTEEASITEIIGEFGGKSTAIVIDDMINTGGTVHALIKKLVTEKGIEEVHLAVSHNLCMEKAGERLVELHQRYELKQLIVTDSIPQTDQFSALPFILIRSLSDIFAHVINSVHFNLSVNEYRDLFIGETAEMG